MPNSKYFSVYNSDTSSSTLLSDCLQFFLTPLFGGSNAWYCILALHVYSFFDDPHCQFTHADSADAISKDLVEAGLVDGKNMVVGR